MNCINNWNPFPWMDGHCICECEKCRSERVSKLAIKKPPKKKKRNKSAEHKKACEKYRQEFVKQNGFPFCENCGKSRTEIGWSVHHIMSAGQYPGYKELHNDRNMILLCNTCHDGFHYKIASRIDEFKAAKERLVKERGLLELFSPKSTE